MPNKNATKKKSSAKKKRQHQGRHTDILEPTIFTIFGISGDLAQRKLLPALYNLELRGMLPRDFYIVGFARRDWSDQFLKDYIAQSVRMSFSDRSSGEVKPGDVKSRADLSALGGLTRPGGLNKAALDRLVQKTHYVRGDFNIESDYLLLSKVLEEIEDRKNRHLNKIFYLAVGPANYAVIFNMLGRAGLDHCCGQEESRILIEKPFGQDGKSAKMLTGILLRHFKESQIYRIDHYLGKEPVQNILSLRFANGILEHLWNNKHIDNIQITVAEQLGVENRGKFYEQTGALLDFVQNHILQLVALTCMEEPDSLETEAIRDQKKKLLDKVEVALDPSHVVKGQYIGYRKELGVNSRSEVETFVALKILARTPRWHGVPIYVRTGKQLAEKFTEIAVQFKQAHADFLGHPDHVLSANVLNIRIYPEESLSLRLMVKRPDFELSLTPAQMNFCYSAKFAQPSPEAYERIIFDAMRGQQMLFVRSDSMIRQWQIIDKLNKSWSKYKLVRYARGTNGPVQQDQMLKRDGAKWWSGEKQSCPDQPANPDQSANSNQSAKK